MKCPFPRTAFIYLASRVLVPVILTLTAFTLVDLLGEGSDRFSNWMSSGTTLNGLEYLALRVPFMVSQLMPVSLLGGIMFAFAMLHRTREIVAFQALGLSRMRIALPALMVAAVIGLFDFALSEGVVPITNARARKLASLRSRIGNSGAADDTWVRTADGFMVAKYYDRTSFQAEDVTVFLMGAYPEVDDILQAQRAIWDGGKWNFLGVHALKVKHGDEILPLLNGHLVVNASPVGLNGVGVSNPEDFSLAQLDAFIAELRRERLDPAGYLVDRALKFALPASCLILAALGVAFSLEVKQKGLGLTLGLAIVSGVGYWIILGFTVSLGKSGLLPATVAAWTPDFLFGLLATSFFLFGEELAL